MSTRLYLLAAAMLLSLAGSARAAANLTAVFEPYKNYTLFAEWLNSTGVANEASTPKTITVLAVTNTVFQNYLDSVQQSPSRQQVIADTLRYQILLSYFGNAQLAKIPAKNHTQVATLLQRTGRVIDSEGFVNIYNTPKGYLVGHYVPDAYGNQTIVTNVTQQPFSYSVLEISNVLLPIPPALPSPSPAPGPPAPPGPSPAPIVAEAPAEFTPNSPGRNSAIGTRVCKPIVLAAVMLIFGIVLL